MSAGSELPTSLGFDFHIAGRGHAQIPYSPGYVIWNDQGDEDKQHQPAGNRLRLKKRIENKLLSSFQTFSLLVTHLKVCYRKSIMLFQEVAQSYGTFKRCHIL